jgi:hypothetical protein
VLGTNDVPTSMRLSWHSPRSSSSGGRSGGWTNKFRRSYCRQGGQFSCRLTWPMILLPSLHRSRKMNSRHGCALHEPGRAVDTSKTSGRRRFASATALGFRSSGPTATCARASPCWTSHSLNSTARLSAICGGPLEGGSVDQPQSTIPTNPHVRTYTQARSIRRIGALLRVEG